MEYYNIIIYKVILFYIPQKNRNIKKTYYKKIDIVKNISKKDLSAETIQLYNKYNPGYIITSVSTKQKDNINDPYIEKLNARSEKQYNKYILDYELKQYNINAKKDILKTRYNNIVNDYDIIRDILKNID